MAIDRTTGQIAWTSRLKGVDFVNVVLDGAELYAATKGELYRLDLATGRVIWNNPLTGMGWGLVTIAPSPDGNRSVMEEKRRKDAEAAAADGAAATM